MSEAAIRVLVVDDEPVARRTLRRLLEDEPGLECVGESWGSAAVPAISEHRPDIVFLDVQMPGMTGFEVLENVEDDILPLVVFVTAFDEYAVRAFEVRAIDYLVKPFTDERFRDVVNGVRERMAQRTFGGPRRLSVQRAAEAAGAAAAADEARRLRPEARRESDRLVIRGSGHALVVRHDEIDWLEAVGSYVRVHAGEIKKLIRSSLGDLVRELDEADLADFCQIHRSSAVNLKRVREVESLDHGDALVRLVDGTELRVSRSRRDEFERALEG
jgi:two-component system LytT family response regulator